METTWTMYVEIWTKVFEVVLRADDARLSSFVEQQRSELEEYGPDIYFNTVPIDCVIYELVPPKYRDLHGADQLQIARSIKRKVLAGAPAGLNAREVDWDEIRQRYDVECARLLKA